MILEKAFQKAGVHVEGDTLPPDERTVKVFKRLIAAIRAAEAEVLKRAADSDKKLNDALQTNLELHERYRVMENRYRELGLKVGMDQIAALTTADKQKLLEAGAA